MPDTKEPAGPINQVMMDLGDFVPEQYEVKFSINGHKYLCSYGEANVEEVFYLLLQEQKDAEAKLEGKEPMVQELNERRRRAATKFLCSHLAEGDAKQLADDIKLLPIKSARGALDVQTLFLMIQSRVKKNESGASPKASRAEPSGLPAK